MVLHCGTEDNRVLLCTCYMMFGNGIKSRKDDDNDTHIASLERDRLRTVLK